MLSLRKTLLAAALMPLALSAATVGDTVMINDGWMMCDAQIVRQKGREAGWRMQNAAREPREGKMLSSNDFKPEGWYKATVPGTVLTTLVNNGVYPEPLYGENNRPEVIPDSLCRRDWWYRTMVDIPSDFAGKTIWLNFEGINYSADIWVNGNRAGVLKGAFRRGHIDITPFVKAGEPASIAVCISPQPTAGEPNEHIMATIGGPCGGVGRLDGPTFGCSVGWDWMSGIRDRNAGIWQDVFLSATGPVEVKDPLITTDLPNLPSTDLAKISVRAVLKNNSDRTQTGTLLCQFDGRTVSSRVTIPAHRHIEVNLSPKDFPALTVKNPRLWWPYSLGKPELYNMKLSFKLGKEISDVKSFDFGIRDIKYYREGGDKLGLTVNGVPVFIKGGNWGLEEALKRIDPKRLEAQVRMHRGANINLIRLWGGQASSKTIYELCDRYGMLLWDEFWQFNDADPADLDLYYANVRDHVEQFRNHPSLVVWCARNEAYPPKYLDDGVRDILAELDPARHYQSNSGGGYGCNSGGPYEWKRPQDFYAFDAQRNFPKHETLKTEIGPQSIPTIESIQGMLEPKDWDAVTDAWAEKNFIAGGGRNLLRTMASRYGEAVNLPDFVRKSQMMNYECFRAIYEGRMSKMFRPVQGVMLWMTTPAQPSFVWQMFHYDLEPNAAMFALKKASEPVHVMFNDHTRRIQIVNHEPDPIADASVRLRFINTDGRIVADRRLAVAAAPTAVTDLDSIALPAGLSDVYFMALELRDATGRLISDNFYWRAKDSAPDDLRQLDKMPAAKLAVKSKVRQQDGRTFVDLVFTNNSRVPAVMTHLQLHCGLKGERVLPAFYSDNYFSLLPGEKKSVTVEAATADLGGARPAVLVDGWNVVTGRKGLVAQNDNASVDSRPRGRFGFRPAPVEPKDVVRVNCGGYNIGDFTKDPGFLDGNSGYIAENAEVDSENAAPEWVYRTVRWGECTYPNILTDPSKTYTLRLHFAELDDNTPAGKRRFAVQVNGETVIPSIDVMEHTGRKHRSYVTDVKGLRTAADGRFDITFKNIKSGAPQISGYEIIPE